jgi:hypothetical protein
MSGRILVEVLCGMGLLVRGIESFWLMAEVVCWLGRKNVGNVHLDERIEYSKSPKISKTSSIGFG